MNLITERLIIRKLENNNTDAQFVYNILNSPGWLKFIGERGIKSLEDAERYLNKRMIAEYAANNYNMYCVTLKETSEPIGLCGLVKRAYLDHHDLGYAFLPAHEGKGYAKEAAEAMILYSFNTGHKKLFAIVTPGNKRSIGLLEKLHFKFIKDFTENNEALQLFELDQTTFTSSTDVKI